MYILVNKTSLQTDFLIRRFYIIAYISSILMFHIYVQIQSQTEELEK